MPNQNQSRLPWDEYFFSVVELIGKRTPCLKRTVGAVIVRDRQILSTGYNGPASGIPHCAKCARDEAKGPLRREDCRAVHAEVNAVTLAAKQGISIDKADIYCSYLPCSNCLSVLINAGIICIYYDTFYEDTLNLSILSKSKIQTVRRIT